MNEHAMVNRKSIVVNESQKGNPILKHIRNVPWEFGTTNSDYEVGSKNSVIFLSARYHKLHPNYIYERLKLDGQKYSLKVLLFLADLPELEFILRELSRVSILLNFTIMIAWSYEEAGRYLETFKAFENKSSQLIREKTDACNDERQTKILSLVRSINKSDAISLMSSFSNLKNVFKSTKADLAFIPGIGDTKTAKILSSFDEPFMLEL